MYSVVLNPVYMHILVVVFRTDLLLADHMIFLETAVMTCMSNNYELSCINKDFIIIVPKHENVPITNGVVDFLFLLCLFL